MASFAVEEFIGDGCLKTLLPMLLEEGWDDVPTLKIMTSEDMAEMNMTQQQKVQLTTKIDFAIFSFPDTRDLCSNSPMQLLRSSIFSSSPQDHFWNFYHLNISIIV